MTRGRPSLNHRNQRPCGRDIYTYTYLHIYVSTISTVSIIFKLSTQEPHDVRETIAITARVVRISIHISTIHIYLSTNIYFIYNIYTWREEDHPNHRACSRTGRGTASSHQHHSVSGISPAAGGGCVLVWVCPDKCPIYCDTSCRPQRGE